MAGNDNTRRAASPTPRPGLFSPTTVKSLQDGGGSNSVFLNKEDSSVSARSSLGSTASFKYDPPGSGIRSTQQLNLDWSKFENHTFFNSAQVKTNVAFDKIINEYPFDGLKSEQEVFLDSLTGFEAWVYDQFPKNKGYMFFSGSASGVEPDDGTYVTVKDLAGAQYPSLSRLRTGETVLDPGLKSMTLEFWINPLNGDSAYDIISLVSGSVGYGVFGDPDVGAGIVAIQMNIASGSVEDQVTMIVPEAEWTHCSFIWDRTPGVETLYGYKNNVLAASSSMPVEFGALNVGGTDMYIGSGSLLGAGNALTSDNRDHSGVAQTFTGSLDELRIWHRVRSVAERKESFRKPVFADGDLKAYYKFNEPSGSNSSLVIDYSSNSVHGRVNTNGLTLGVRELATGSLAGESPMSNETLFNSPVLFPEVEASVELRDDLLLSASNYDEENPNLISRQIPGHYLMEGQGADGLSTEEGDILTDLDGTEPREASLGSTQVLLSLLYTWAKFFDEMKLYIQAFSTLKNLDYDIEDTIPNDFLSVFAKNEGIELPPLFTGTSIEQYIEGENLQGITSRDIFSLQSVQNQIWRRILINLQDVLKSKGTIHSIKSFIRSVGINPDNNFRIREYGGPSKQPLTFNREKRFEVSTMLDFVSGGWIASNELSSSVKSEPGFPLSGPSGSANLFWTSGSFTCEGIYKWEATPFASKSHDGSGNPLAGITQSLMRMESSAGNTIFGTEDTSSERLVIANLIAVTSSVASAPVITLHVKTIADSIADGQGLPFGKSGLQLPLTGANIFNGKKWYVSWGRKRGDDGTTVPSNIAFPSSSYFVRAARQENGDIIESYVTSAYFDDNDVITNGDTGNIWQRDLGIEAPRIMIGSSSHPVEDLDRTVAQFLTSSHDISQGFSGKVSQLRFHSKFLTDVEWKEHVVNYRSVGSLDPRKNFNFLGTAASGSNRRFTNVSGSWERLRLDASTDQVTTSSSDVVSGNIILTDFTQYGHEINDLSMNTGLGEKSGRIPGGFFGSGFPRDTAVIKPEQFWFSFLSPRIDEGVAENKVRVRGFQDSDLAFSTPWSDLAPVHQINPREVPTDSAKLSIDFSIADTVDQDIMTIFGSLDDLNNILGDPELQFAAGYHELDVIREMYFEKLEKKINLKGFFEFYKWFDTNIGTFVEQLVPRKTKFLGTNFVIESHFLERSKVQYQFEDIYLGEDNRSGLKDTILLQLITGKFTRF